MNPPITIQVRTDNLHSCKLIVRGANPDEVYEIKVPSDGNVYQGLHAIRGELERVVNDILGYHGVTAPPPPSVKPTEEERTAALEAEVAELQAKAAARQRLADLEAEKERLLDEATRPATPTPAADGDTATEEKAPVEPS